MSEIIIEINGDGSVKINASKMKGTDKEILAELQELAKSIGGELVVEKHIHKGHVHQTGRGRVHS